MTSALTELRITQFKKGKLELIVTPSEAADFFKFVSMELAPVHKEQLIDLYAFLAEPDDSTIRHTCVFYMIPNHENQSGYDLVHKDILSPVDVNTARIPFALMSDRIAYLTINPDPPKTKLDDEWGMEKIELRNKVRGIEANFSTLMAAMELLKMQIDGLVKATDAKDPS